MDWLMYASLRCPFVEMALKPDAHHVYRKLNYEVSLTYSNLQACLEAFGMLVCHDCVTGDVLPRPPRLRPNRQIPRQIPPNRQIPFPPSVPPDARLCLSA